MNRAAQSLGRLGGKAGTGKALRKARQIWGAKAGVQDEIQSRIYRGELDVTDADGVETMRGQQ